MEDNHDALLCGEGEMIGQVASKSGTALFTLRCPEPECWQRLTYLSDLRVRESHQQISETNTKITKFLEWNQWEHMSDTEYFANELAHLT